jgi:tRNA pseudouridine38-40 synthase
MTRTLRCTVSYDGAAFAGFQRQPDRVTVQGVLESAIARVTGEQSVVVGAGRTDAGVHALGQVIHFATGTGLTSAKLLTAINGCLPPAVRVRQVMETAPAFHARFDARSREYRYLVENAGEASPLWRHRVAHVRKTLNVPAMEAAASAMVGRHDFAAFGSPMVHSREVQGRERPIEIRGGTVRTMLAAGCWRQARFVHFRFVADAFLRHMVRMLTGTLLRIGTGSLVKEALEALLRGDHSFSAGPAVPAHGLYLVCVRY